MENHSHDDDHHRYILVKCFRVIIKNVKVSSAFLFWKSLILYPKCKGNLLNKPFFEKGIFGLRALGYITGISPRNNDRITRRITG